MLRALQAVILVLMTTNLFSQAPARMSYQAVIRNASNNLVSNTPVRMRISILQGSANGTAVYSEVHNPTTNANGLVSVEIGGGTSATGTFSSINWGNGTYFLKTETDPADGTNYSIVGTSQLLSVPYALESKSAGDGVKGVSNDTLTLNNGDKYVIPGIKKIGNTPSNINNGLIGYWPFNGNANDESNNGLNGQPFGVELTTDRFGKSNAAYNFDYTTVGFGTRTDEIYIPYSPILNTPQITISLWVYQRQYFWSGNNNPPMSTLIARFQFGYSIPKGEVWMVNSGTNGINGFAGAPNINLNKWTHILTTYENGIGKIYINGKLISTQTNMPPLNIKGNSGISIGQSNQANGYWWPTDGKIDDIRIYNRVLTQEEITFLYNN